MGKLQDKIALITGSSHGIGSAIARRFANEGAKVVLHGRDKDALESLRREISDKGGEVISLIADVTKFNEIEAMRKSIEKELGPVEVLVVNAGGSHTKPMPFEEIPEDGWHASVDANLTATFLTIKSFLPGMKAQKRGNIITMSSAAARHTSGKSPVPYSAA
ncbi:MAG: SDR family NAD(P)-dependent oxidoreductase, partial [Ignavibacteria bacterium]|nr:SDR family NAD(P)-dependent oxidoreductase [Ignavibacteria bacterium]